MPPQTVRLYNPKGPDRMAVVSVQPATAQVGTYLIQLARGTGPGPLTKGTVYGPIAAADLDARFAEVLAALKSEGFVGTGLHDLLAKLHSPNAAIRARAALGVGRRHAREGVEPILNALPNAVDEVCSYLDALGALGDARAIPVLREHAGRKLLSRRRSAVEALRNLGDADGLATVRQQALERLPENLRTLVQDHHAERDEYTGIIDAILALKIEQRGLALDTLYELATPLSVGAVRAALEHVSFDQVFIWRYVKSIDKRAMLRHDYVTWGMLSHAIENAARNLSGTYATVKSGYDGTQRHTRIFGGKTQRYMRRLSWRYLRQLAASQPDGYAKAAAEALIPYTPDDGEEPHGLYGPFSASYLLHRILWGGSKRFVMSDRSLRFRYRSAAEATAPNAREEAYPELWDVEPQAYVRLLAAARLPEVHAFALRAIEARHPNVVGEADAADIVAFLQAPYEPTVKLGLAELERRFDPAHPDWALLDQLLRGDQPAARELGERWLRLTVPQWSQNLLRTMAWLSSPHPGTRTLAAELTIAAYRDDASRRANLADYLLGLVRTSQLKDDVADGVVAVAQALLLDELAPRVSLPELTQWIEAGSLVMLPLWGDLLGRRTEAISVDQLAWFAQHDIAAIRGGAQQWIRRAEAYFRDDPSLLLLLAESDWPDTRQTAVELLRAVLQPETLDLDGLLAFLDSSHVEVQNLGQELTQQRLASLPADKLVFRLAQHPDPNMRHFVLNLATQHLPDGAEPLARLEMFFRAGLLDLWPERLLKKRVLDFVTERGLRDEEQAAVAVRILSDVVRMQGRADFERALEGMARLKLAYPAAASPLRLLATEDAK